MKQGSRTAKNEDCIQLIFVALKKLISPLHEPRKRISFKLAISLT